MFGKKKKDKLHHHIDTLIGIKTKISGDIQFSGGLRIDGHVCGNITASDDTPGTLVLSDKGHVEGKIQVANAIINGKVTGPIHATEYLELQADAQVNGDVYYGSMEIQLGATIEGKMIRQSSQQPEKTVTLIPASPE